MHIDDLKYYLEWWVARRKLGYPPIQTDIKDILNDLMNKGIYEPEFEAILSSSAHVEPTRDKFNSDLKNILQKLQLRYPENDKQAYAIYFQREFEDFLQGKTDPLQWLHEFVTGGDVTSVFSDFESEIRGFYDTFWNWMDFYPEYADKMLEGPVQISHVSKPEDGDHTFNPGKIDLNLWRAQLSEVQLKEMEKEIRQEILDLLK